MSINLASADKASLKAYALSELDGLKLPLTMSENTMRDRIVARCGELGIEAPESKMEAVTSKNVNYLPIIIAKTDKHDGAENAFVAVNCVGYSIPRGIKVEVPDFVVEALKNAMQDHVTQDNETGELHHEDVPTYAYQVLAA